MGQILLGLGLGSLLKLCTSHKNLSVGWDTHK